MGAETKVITVRQFEQQVGHAVARSEGHSGHRTDPSEVLIIGP